MFVLSSQRTEIIYEIAKLHITENIPVSCDAWSSSALSSTK